MGEHALKTRVGEVASFALIGCIGFLVDGGLLSLLNGAHGWGPIEARFLSFPLAVFVTWLLNRMFTFRNIAQVMSINEYGRYIAVQVVGTAINLMIYSALITLVPSFEATPVVPLAFGAVVAMVVNYSGSRLYVFRTP